MDWKELDLKHDPFRILPLSAGKEIEARLQELLFGDDAAIVRAEAYLKENWKSLAGSAGSGSRPDHLDRGVLIVQDASPAAAQEIQLRLFRIKEKLKAHTGYELKGFRFDVRERRLPQKRDGQVAAGSDTKKKAGDSEADIFLADIRRTLGLSESHADLPDSRRTGPGGAGIPERNPGRR